MTVVSSLLKNCSAKSRELILLFYRYTPNEKDPFKAFSKLCFPKVQKLGIKLRISKHPKQMVIVLTDPSACARKSKTLEQFCVMIKHLCLSKRLSDNDRFAVFFRHKKALLAKML